MGFRTLSVSEVSMYVSKVFEAEEMLHDIQVKGEISSFQIKNGIAYYSLKDDNCIINCITFGAEKYSQLKNGDEVVATGNITYYGKGGRLNFSVYKLEASGRGDIYKKFLLLKEKLEKEGLFDKSTKKPLPKHIAKIGVVTSQTGAVIQDIINVSTRRNPSINIVLYPAKVQGDGADLTLIEGIEYFENKEDIDVVIIARGGGSIEDLQAFNSELLARTVYKSNKVIVSAVGHETDYTIIDFVADLRAPTPSAAAELVTQDVLIIKNKLNMLKDNLFFYYDNLIKSMYDKNYDAKECLLSEYFNFLRDYVYSVKDKASKLIMLKDKAYEKKMNKLILLNNSLSDNNPAKLLMSGYAKVFSEDKVVKSVKQLNVNDEIKISFADGKVLSKITNIEV